MMDIQNGYCDLALSDSLSNIAIQEKCKYCEYYYNFKCRSEECICDDTSTKREEKQIEDYKMRQMRS